MAFASVGYLLFLAGMALLVWLCRRQIVLRNALLLAGSLVFYWPFGPMAVTTLLSICLAAWLGGRWVGAVAAQDTAAPLWRMRAVVAISVAVLAGFKLWPVLMGLPPAVPENAESNPEAWIIPAGLSFITFRAISYIVDIQRRRMDAVCGPLDVFTALAFFPAVLSGPLERMPSMIGQLRAAPRYDGAALGVRLIILGLFRKLIIGDGAGSAADYIFTQQAHLPGLTLLVGIVAYAVQIYADFAGYTDIARGSAALLGFRLAENFRFPYFARSIPEYWSRWHMSLSAWLNDYVFTPLAVALRRRKRRGLWLALLVTFLVSAVWHGLGWAFVVWGLLHAVYYIPAVWGKGRLLSITQVHGGGKAAGGWRGALAGVRTFGLVCLALVFFRSATAADGAQYLTSLFTRLFQTGDYRLDALPYVALLFFADAVLYRRPALLERPRSAAFWLWQPLAVITLLYLLFHADEHAFIYFRF